MSKRSKGHSQIYKNSKIHINMIKPPIATISIIGIITLSSPFCPVAAGNNNGSLQNVAEREIVRREAGATRAKKLIADGDKAMHDKNYDVAVVQYKTACDLLPESPATHELRYQALESFGEASVKLAEQRIVEGRFADAEATAKVVVEEQYNPTYKPALQLLAHLEQSGYYNKTVGPKFYDRVQEVKKLFTEADGFYDTGRFDLAYKRYEQILNLDPYNIAARKGEEKVNVARDNYANEAYDTTRSYMYWKVTQAWELPPRKYQGREVVKIDTGATTIRNTEYIQNKLNHIIVPKIEFKDATIREAVDFLKQKSRELDTTEPDAARRGVNIVLKLDTNPGLGAPAAPAAPAAAAVPGLPAAPADAAAAAVPAAPSIVPSEARITLSLTNIPLSEALRYITNLAGLKVKIDPYAVTIVPLSEVTDALITKEYKVPPGFLNSAASTGIGGANALSGGARKAGGGSADTTTPNQIGPKVTALEYLTQNGVQFPQGASANYLPSSSKLIVRNTEQNLDLVDTIVEASVSAVPVQVNIESKFVEIQQTNFKELSFDTLVGAGKFTSGGAVQFSGGAGTTNTPSTGFPFIQGTQPVGTNPISGGLRSGGFAVNQNAIDGLLAGTTGQQSAAPGIFAVSGVLTDPQFQFVIRALNQKKGIDLLASPSVTTKSGQRAVIEIIREFRYPTEFQPPQIPQTVNSSGAGSIPITPTTPTAFETRNTGVTLEVEPVVGPDGQTIDLNLVPQTVDFDGFINYGSPILTPATQGFTQQILNAAGALVGQIIFPASPGSVLTANVINQPIFDTRKVTTSVSVWDGQTVMIGGLIREDVQKVQDKIPGLGDIPLIGRLFRSSVDQHIKRNLIIFVTARLINPAGELVHEDEEKEEEVAPLTTPDLATPPSLPEMPLQK
jgi:general secretion pathway protein D